MARSQVSAFSALLQMQPPAPCTEILCGRRLHAAQGGRAKFAGKQRARAAAQRREALQQHLCRRTVNKYQALCTATDMGISLPTSHTHCRDEVRANFETADVAIWAVASPGRWGVARRATRPACYHGTWPAEAQALAQQAHLHMEPNNNCFRVALLLLEGK